MRLPVRWTPDAAADTVAIWEYIAADNPVGADRMIGRFVAALHHLAESPYLGRTYQTLGAGVRGLIVGRYVVFYRQIDNVIQILRVLHGARDIDALFRGDTADRQGKR